ncbi:MAG: glycine cleavage system aminomethyltransferase GcvT [Alphaproteobacteria bacterium]|nr:glycine cleavage system aminomethyltransferase GcvT [Alphaproteobacteria bacterium]
MNAPLKTTPLNALHRELGAKMVEFAGYDMPVQYPTGVLKEHLHTRAAAGLFDVSHMGQGAIMGDAPAAAFEVLVPGSLQELKPGQTRYTLLLNDQGGIRDDLMVTRPLGDDDFRTLFLVVNAGCKDRDFALINERLGTSHQINRFEDRALLALQGPKAAEVFARHCPEAATLKFMTAAKLKVVGFDCYVWRSGYTGEDGYEISVPGDTAEDFARKLLAEPEVLPIGLGARDSLRLEAGLPLYGHDLDETTTPVEAALTFAIGKRRKLEKNFPGADIIMDQLFNGAKRKRVGFRSPEKAPAREGTEIHSKWGEIVGRVTSGGFSPTLNGPVAMGYVETEYSGDDYRLLANVRGQQRALDVSPMPFVPHRYFRG